MLYGLIRPSINKRWRNEIESSSEEEDEEGPGSDVLKKQ